MTIIRHSTITGTVVDSHLPRVGYENYFRSGTVTASSEDQNHPRQLAYDGFTYDGWRSTGGATEWIRVQGAALTADYMAIGAHTLSGCTLTPQSSDDAAAWTDLHTGTVQPDNRPVVWEFDSDAANYWRLLIGGATGAVQIGAIHVGRKLKLDNGLPVGWAPPSLNEEIEHTNTISEGGQTLGRNILRRGVRVNADTNRIAYTWSRASWDAFIQVAQQYAVFMWWAYQGYGEVVYGGLEASSATFSTEALVSTRFRLAGVQR